MGGLRHPAYTLARTPLGRLLIAVGRAAPLSVAWLPLAGFLLPSSPLPQVALAAVARAAIGGSWSPILFSLGVAVGLWPLLREGATSKSFAAGGAHALLCILNFLGSSRTLGVVSRLA